ncbi:hypothetical protein TNCV_500351 [Trichonephila clavipes]|nr:hypothetical protein TNCV_500351 [Trichonephila clavipes]
MQSNKRYKKEKLQQVMVVGFIRFSIGDHARASSTTDSTIMSDISDSMDFSPTRQTQVAASEKLRDTVTGISALHKSLHEITGHSPSPKHSFTELYRTSTQAMIMRKEEMVIELKTLPSPMH